jgi:hypothetical protein
MKRKKTISLLSFFACVIALTPFQLGWEARGQSDRLSGRTITGTAYFIGGRTAGRSLPFRLVINRLTTPDEVNQLNEALQSGKQDGLLKVLSHMEAGRIQIGTDVGVPANAIIASQEGDRTKLTVLYQRNLRFAELRYGARSADYRFGYAELYIGPGGGNQGMLIPAAMVRLKGGNTWEVEDFGTFPARLMGLQVRGKGRSDVR